MQLSGTQKRILFPFYNPRHKALTGPKLTNSKNPDIVQGIGWLRLEPMPP